MTYCYQLGGNTSEQSQRARYVTECLAIEEGVWAADGLLVITSGIIGCHAAIIVGINCY